MGETLLVRSIGVTENRKSEAPAQKVLEQEESKTPRAKTARGAPAGERTQPGLAVPQGLAKVALRRRGEFAVDFEDGAGGVVAADQAPAAEDADGFSGAGGLDHLAFPEAAGADGGVGSVGGQREMGLEQVVTVLAENFFGRIAVEGAGALVPEADVIIEIAQEHGVVKEIEDLGLVAESAFEFGFGAHVLEPQDQEAGFRGFGTIHREVKVFVAELGQVLVEIELDAGRAAVEDAVKGFA
jgi:hypothetical protein